jgi:8-oxo-dGTP pyrophosphatase MutT (NUDIX family)
MKRHFTVSGFVSDGQSTALHWHRIGKWLPAGGHVEADEDPIEAVLREVKEETGIDVDVVATVEPYGHQQPPQLPPPVTIGIYDLGPDGHSDEAHQHIDFVYFTRPANGASLALPDDEHAWVWVHEATLRDHPQLPLASCGAEMPIEDDVRRLALASIVAARDATATGGS